MREDVSSKKLLASLLALAILAAVIPCAAALDSAALPAIIVRLDELKDVMEEKRRIVAAIVKRAIVSRGYEIHIQFCVGLDVLKIWMTEQKAAGAVHRRLLASADDP